MKVVTKSGSVYQLERAVSQKHGLPFFSATRNGELIGLMLGIFPDRLPFFNATKTWQRVDEKLAGFNDRGVRTLLLEPTQLKPGMILCEGKQGGIVSTPIVEIQEG